MNNLIEGDSISDMYLTFKTEFDKQQADIINHHADLLREKLFGSLGSDASFIMIGQFNKNFIAVFNEIYSGTSHRLTLENIGELNTLTSKTPGEIINILVFPVTKDHLINTKIVKIGSRYQAKINNGKLHIMNYNLDTIESPRHWIYRFFEKPAQYYYIAKADPKSAFMTMVVDIGRIFKIR
jgi:hypothetical protein